MHHKAETHGHDAAAPETAGSTIRWARWYDLASWLLSFGRAGAIRKEIVKVANPQAGESVLDVGCGTGTLAITMKNYAGGDLDITGIDAAVEMVDVARRKAEKAKQNIRFEPAVIEALPFPDAQFDLATSTYMLHHLPDDVKRDGLREVRRVLAPGGRLLAVDFASSGGGVVGHLLSAFGHAHAASSFPELAEVLREAGFTNVREIATKRKELMFVMASAPNSEIQG
jgi:ubiquinone/menaquinone biosynthesis C-methylase UbiE